MPTRRVRDTAGQIKPDVAVVAPEPVKPPGVTAAAAAAALTELANASLEPASDENAGFSEEQVAALQRLRQLGSRRAAARAELERVEGELLGEAILEAFKYGIPKQVIAKESGVARQTVYNVIDRADT